MRSGTSTDLELGDFMVVNAISINGTFGGFMGDEAHITAGNDIIGSPINERSGFVLRNGMLVLTSVGCNHNIDLTGTSRLNLALGAVAAKDPCNDIWLLVTVATLRLVLSASITTLTIIRRHSSCQRLD